MTKIKIGPYGSCTSMVQSSSFFQNSIHAVNLNLLPFLFLRLKYPNSSLRWLCNLWKLLSNPFQVKFSDQNFYVRMSWVHSLSKLFMFFDFEVCSCRELFPRICEINLLCCLAMTFRASEELRSLLLYSLQVLSKVVFLARYLTRSRIILKRRFFHT
jgi:hypothetical protein